MAPRRTRLAWLIVLVLSLLTIYAVLVESPFRAIVIGIEVTAVVLALVFSGKH